MNRRSAGMIAAVMLMGAAGRAWPATQAEARRPNIVFILMDDMRWDCMSIAGHPFLKTPNLDRIGKEGALMQIAAVAASAVGRWLHVSPPSLRLMVGCGAAAGCSASTRAAATAAATAGKTG